VLLWSRKDTGSGGKLEDFSLLRDFALIMVVAGIVTLILRKLRQPPILGYLLAGLLLSPYFVPFYSVNDIHSIGLLADIGLVLLLFGVGLEFGWSKIRQIGIAALIIGGIEIATMISLGYGLGRLLGWSRMDAIFLGAALQSSSSAIIVKILKDLGKLNLVSTRVIVGILVVEDFVAVIIIALLSGISAPGIAGFDNISSLILKLVIFAAVSLTLGAILVPRILAFTHRFNSRETLLIVSLGLCFALALASKELGLSVAAGAFLIGALVGDTPYSEDVVEVMSPVRDMFAALFFVAIGMLIDLTKFRDFLLPAVIVVIVFVVGKIVSNTIAAIVNGYTARDSFRVGMAMPQMGEFSLAIAKVGVDQGSVAAPLYPVITVATTLTTIISPFLTRSADSVGDFLGKKSPRLLREYIIHLNDWGQTIHKSFPRRSQEGQRIQKKARAIFINFLILMVIISVGTFALQNIEVLVQHFPLRRDIIALIMGSFILALCLPSVLLIWRNLRTIIDETTRPAPVNSAALRSWQGERFRRLLRYSTTIVLAVLIFLWLIPFISQLLFIGSSALVLPAIILAFALYLVIRSIRGVHQQLERTFSQVFLGEEQVSSSGEGNLRAARATRVRRLIFKLKIAAERGSSWWLQRIRAKGARKTQPDKSESDSEE
jgi:monovalent cation:H+ antiporter-2, CPA2 family